MFYSWGRPQRPLLDDARGLAPPLRSPICRRSALHPGDFPVAGKVTKGAPRAAPFGIPRCVVAALFALAAHRAGLPFSHKNRPICHFEFVGKSVFVFSSSYTRGHTLCCQSVARQLGLASAGCPEFLPFLGGAALAAAGGMIMPPKGSTQRGCPPLGDSLVTFSSGRKSPGCRAERLHQEAQGLPAPQKFPGAGARRPLAQLKHAVVKLIIHAPAGPASSSWSAALDDAGPAPAP